MNIRRIVAASLTALLSALPVQAQSNCVTPPVTGQTWPAGSTINVYIDSTIADPATYTPSSEYQQISDAVAEIGDQVYVTGAKLELNSPRTDPNAPNLITFTNLPQFVGSSLQAGFGYTSTMAYQSGSLQGHTGSATISFNLNATLGAEGEPAYSASLPGYDTIFIAATSHELGHAFGLTDVPLPLVNGQAIPVGVCSENSDPTPGQSATGPSIMNGICNTNDVGLNNTPNIPSDATNCDYNALTSLYGTFGGSSGSSGGGGSGSTNGGGGGGGEGPGVGGGTDPGSGGGDPGGTCYWYDDTNTLYCP